jgi:hypothetical protein
VSNEFFCISVQRIVAKGLAEDQCGLMNHRCHPEPQAKDLELATPRSLAALGMTPRTVGADRAVSEPRNGHSERSEESQPGERESAVALGMRKTPRAARSMAVTYWLI